MALGGRCAKKHGTVEPLQHNTIETSIAALRNGRLAIGCRAQDDKANARAHQQSRARVIGPTYYLETLSSRGNCAHRNLMVL